MTDNSNAAVHADEADIIRWLDGALTNDERRALEGHVASCAECAALRRTVARRSMQISNLLRTIDMPASATPLRLSVRSRSGSGGLAMPPRWRVAAVLTLALAGAAAVPPVRAWVIGMARSAWSFARGRQADTVTHTGNAPQAGLPGEVAFKPVGTVLTIRVPARPAGGLTLEVVEGDRVSAVGSLGQPVPGLLVLPDELRIDDSAQATDYLVRVPLGLKTVRVLIGPREEVFQPSRVGERRVFPLAP